ncbi:hypothetical protein CANINC_000539 [Pichia inconspicua]|uniref:Reverse transcriptase Ty1/copia-type domain-containing protein n=1 Tax=Pichia inconspicua TaxID=52247 RepID=A0A4T0X6B9_9ASCO|nr:hypothetical protein CANINC_000539 [[Candida] inconspicua]
MILLEKYHDQSLTLQESSLKVMHNQQRQTENALDLCKQMFEKLSERPSDIPPESGLLNLTQSSHNKTKLNSMDNKQQQSQQNNQPLLKGQEPPALLEYHTSSSDMDTEHKELTVPETPNFEVDFPSTSTPMEDYKRAMELAHKYALNPSMKRITHANDDDEYLTLVSKQKKLIQEGPSLHARAVNPDGSVHEVSKAISKVATNALNEEMKSIQANKVYRKIRRTKVPPKALIVKSRLVFSVKQEKDLQTMRDYDRFKVRLVAKGFTQEIGVNYLDIYSPVMKYDSLRVVLTIAGIKKWNIRQLDAKNAFLNGDLDYKRDLPDVFLNLFDINNGEITRCWCDSESVSGSDVTENSLEEGYNNISKSAIIDEGHNCSFEDETMDELVEEFYGTSFSFENDSIETTEDNVSENVILDKVMEGANFKRYIERSRYKRVKYSKDQLFLRSPLGNGEYIGWFDENGFHIVCPSNQTLFYYIPHCNSDRNESLD